MRLLDVSNLDDIHLVEFTGTVEVEYTILSHCWSHDDATKEVDHRSFLAKDYDPEGAAWKKIQKCCELTKDAGYQFTWVDTCCIDKSSSAELSESINSMFAWYKNAAVCFVFLHDYHVPEVDMLEHVAQLHAAVDNSIATTQYPQAFVRDRWFKRSWTLQELLAPTSLVIYSSNHIRLRTRQDLAAVLSYASGIEQHYLEDPRRISEASVAQRMSWASHRSSHRVEDTAYSLLGLFDINMPLLYGEGDKAFLRLQEEILRSIEDDSLLAWSSAGYQTTLSPILAKHPSAFQNCGNVKREPQTFLSTLYQQPPYALTHRGMAIHTRTLQNNFFYKFYMLGHVDYIDGEHRIRLRCRDFQSKTWLAQAGRKPDEKLDGTRLWLFLHSIRGTWYRAGLYDQRRRFFLPYFDALGPDQVIYASTARDPPGPGDLDSWDRERWGRTTMMYARTRWFPIVLNLCVVILNQLRRGVGLSWNMISVLVLAWALLGNPILSTCFVIGLVALAKR